MALNRYQSLEKNFQKNTYFGNHYHRQLAEYISHWYPRELSSREAETFSETTNYIPQSGVLNINKPGKVRVVYNASLDTTLSDNLVCGIDLLNNLILVLLIFQEVRCAVITDIEIMFHQIEDNAKNTDVLHILWRANPKCFIEDYCYVSARA